MAINKIDAKIRIKRDTTIGATPSIPTSTDHTDGSWNSTDIYVGELFLNTQDDLLWLRTDNGLKSIPTDITWDDNGTEIQLNTIHAGKPIIPDTNKSNDIGTSAKYWKDLYLGGDIRQKYSSTVTTTNATATIIQTILGSSLSIRNTYLIEAVVTAIKTDYTTGISSKLTGSFRIPASGITQISTTNVLTFTEFTTAVATMLTDGTDIFIRVKGEASTTINWKCSVKIIGS